MFSNTCLYNANLENVILRRAYLGGCDLRQANLEGVYFGQYPSLLCESEVMCINFNKDGTQLAVGLQNGNIELFNKKGVEYKHIATLRGHSSFVHSVALSPDLFYMYPEGRIYICTINGTVVPCFYNLVG